MNFAYLPNVTLARNNAAREKIKERNKDKHVNEEFKYCSDIEKIVIALKKELED